MAATVGDVLVVAGDADPGERTEVDPSDLLLWAVRAAVISHYDLKLRLDVDPATGAKRRVIVRALDCHRRRAESALRAACQNTWPPRDPPWTLRELRPAAVCALPRVPLSPVRSPATAGGGGVMQALNKRSS